ncbi:unnamed protein product [Ambrosiozyma monospora]|uniref:Unnamed protein product n=1 Tax=Ambrosiozyma monospora TaxID=43982 RepID=A0ACB5U122_AMBMO|nr:unnamed protein product [Ambrosiozyma monospora]
MQRLRSAVNYLHSIYQAQLDSMTTQKYQLKEFEQEIFIPVPGTDIKLCAIVALPKALFHDHYVKNYSPPTHRLVILMHGQSGHKNYCYLKDLAEQLSEKLGIYSVRFDFRNCGGSTIIKPNTIGRTVEDDIEDLNAVYNYFVNQHFNDTAFFVEAVIGHSRGSLDMFCWGLERKAYVPNFINCAGRFDGAGKGKNSDLQYPGWRKAQGFYEPTCQGDRYKDVWIPARETLSMIARKLTNVGELDQYTDVLSIYGLEESVIPLQDAASFANHLAGRHTLHFIEEANHSYMGVVKIDPTIVQKHKHPIHRKKQVYNYNYMVSDKIVDYLGPESRLNRFYKSTLKIHPGLNRWKDVEGISNFRDVGGWSTQDGNFVRPGIAFRCANPSNVTEKVERTSMANH